MKCKKVQEILLTEYMDERLDAKENLDIKEHLEGCSRCREYYNLLNNEVTGPLRKAQQVTPPEKVWQGIRNKIIEKSLAREKEGILERVRSMLILRKPVMALVSVLLIVAIFSGIKISEYVSYVTVRNFIQEEMTLVNEVEDESSEFNGNGFGTSIEEYFL